MVKTKNLSVQPDSVYDLESEMDREGLLGSVCLTTATPVEITRGGELIVQARTVKPLTHKEAYEIKRKMEAFFADKVPPSKLPTLVMIQGFEQQSRRRRRDVSPGA